MARSIIYMALGNGIGTIQAGETQQDRLDEITQRVIEDAFYVPVESAVPSVCIDGRIGTTSQTPNAAGGSETLMVADDLTFQRFKSGDGSTEAAYEATLQFLTEQGFPIGGHTDEHARDEKSGCGANDRTADIYRFIAEHADWLQETASALGVNISDTVTRKLARNAKQRTQFSPGAQLLSDLRRIGGESAAPALQGEHREVVAVINTVRGTTLNRQALEDEFGPEYEAFNIDVWSFTDAAEAIAENESQMSELVAAMTFYNLATAHVLCGPEMRVVIRA